MKKIFSVFLTILLMGNVYSQQKGDIRMFLQNASSEPYEVGQEVELTLRVDYMNVPVGARIYAHLLPLSDTSWALANGGTFNVEKPSLSLSGEFTNKDNSMFHFSPSNYPISMLLKKEQIAMFIGNLFGSSSETNNSFAESICDRDDGFGFTLSFLLSVGNNTEGSEIVQLAFTIPNYPKYYNGIVISPFIFIKNKGKGQVVYIDAEKMQSVKIKVKPNRFKEDLSSDISSENLPGRVEIQSVLPSNALIIPGTKNTIKYNISYENLHPGTAIYLAMLPKTGNKVMNRFGSGSATGIKGIGKIEFYDSISPYLKIPKENFPACITPLGYEIALIKVIKEGGSGNTSEMVSFIPPVFAEAYQFIHFVPVLVIPVGDGNKVLIDEERLKGIDILNSEWQGI